MKIQVNADGFAIVDGVPRQIDVRDMNSEITVVFFDTVRGSGVIQYRDDVTVPSQERDFVAEKAAEDYARAHNLPPPEEPIFRTVQIPKPDAIIDSIAAVQGWYDRWVEAEPPPVVQPQPDPRLVEIDQNLSSGLIGGLTRDQLKALSVAEYNAWFQTNFTTNAQLIGLLRRLTLLCIRRLL